MPGSRSGRPPKDPTIRLEVDAWTCFTQVEKAVVVQRAAAEGKSLSAYLRAAALSRPVPEVVPAINQTTFQHLARVGGNLNQWMHLLNSGQVPPIGSVSLVDLAELRQLVVLLKAQLVRRPSQVYEKARA